VNALIRKRYGGQKGLDASLAGRHGWDARMVAVAAPIWLCAVGDKNDRRAIIRDVCQMKLPAKENLLATALTACILALVTWIAARFEGAPGTGTRIDTRHCDLGFSRQ
jgi:hypothetical protein